MITPQQISALSNNLNENIPKLLELFNIDYVNYPNRYSFPCPVHGGDNAEACSIFIDGKTNWSCWTHSCQDKYKKTLFGFVRGVLSFRAGKEVSVDECGDFCMKFLNCTLENIQVVEENLSIKNQLKMLEVFEKKPTRSNTKIDRKLVINTLQIPSKYYLNRGFSADILTQFDIGDCINPAKSMYNRAVVPVYDENYNYVGCTARAMDDETKPKWKNSTDLKKSQFLYGLHAAKEHIIKTGVVILVEGQGDVWRAHEVGFKNTVGIMGANLSEEQLILLECSGCMNVLVLTDMDEPGHKAAEQIIKVCGRRFNCHRFLLPDPYKDIGDMNNTELRTFLENICRKF